MHWKERTKVYSQTRVRIVFPPSFTSCWKSFQSFQSLTSHYKSLWYHCNHFLSFHLFFLQRDTRVQLPRVVGCASVQRRVECDGHRVRDSGRRKGKRSRNGMIGGGYFLGFSWIFWNHFHIVFIVVLKKVNILFHIKKRDWLNSFIQLFFLKKKEKKKQNFKIN